MKDCNSEENQTNQYGFAKKSFQSIRAQVKAHKYQQSSEDLWNQLSFVDTELKKHEQVHQSHKSQKLLNQQQKSQSIYKYCRNKQLNLTERTTKQEKTQVSFDANNQPQRTIKAKLNNKSVPKQIIYKGPSPLKNHNKQRKIEASRQTSVKKIMFKRAEGNQKNTKMNQNNPDILKMRQSTELLQKTTQAFQYFAQAYANDEIKCKKVNKIFKDLIMMIQI